MCKMLKRPLCFHKSEMDQFEQHLFELSQAVDQYELTLAREETTVILL